MCERWPFIGGLDWSCYLQQLCYYPLLLCIDTIIFILSQEKVSESESYITFVMGPGGGGLYRMYMCMTSVHSPTQTVEAEDF